MTTPWTPDDDRARQLLDERIETYDLDPAGMTLWERIIVWLNDALAISIDPTGTGSVVLQVLLIIAVGVLAFLVFRYFRPSVSPDTDRRGAHLADPSVPAEEYLAAAQRALAAHEFDQAYLQAYRFIVRSASDRGLVEVTPATTATTFGGSLGAVLPEYREALAEASTEFNRISYGGSVPTRESAETVLQLAQSIAAAHPQAGGHSDPARLMPR